MSKMRIVVMGSGGSGGVPYAGNIWGDCDPKNPKNRRTRPSVYIEKDDTHLVIDTGPEFRLQLNATGMTSDQLLDAVLYTHAHNDHIMGLDDLRTFWFRSGKKPVPVYGSTETLQSLKKRFHYAFETVDPFYPPTVIAHDLTDPLIIKNLEIKHFEQNHGNIKTTGYRIGDFGYSTDVSDLPIEALDALKGIKIWIVGAFPTDEDDSKHAGLNSIKKWVDYIKPEMTYLTHLNARADYDALCERLPANIRPAYDGLEIIL